MKIATLIHDIYNRITPSCLEHIIQRKEHKYDLRHQHRVGAQRFETYCTKNSISRRGSIVWNILEPFAVSAREYAKRAEKSHPPPPLIKFEIEILINIHTKKIQSSM